VWCRDEQRQWKEAVVIKVRDRRVKVRWAELDEGHDVWKDIDSDVTAYAARSNKVMSCRPSPPGVTAAALLHGLHAAKPSNEEPSNVESAAHHALASLVQAADTAAEEARAAVEPYGTAQYSSSFDGIPHYVGPPPLSSLPPTQLYPILSQLQLFREDAMNTPEGAYNPVNMLIRLNMSAATAKYVGAQIVSLHGDEVQVRGIEGAPTPIQRTRLQYVSNQPFSAAELSGLEAKLRARTVKDMSVADAELAITELSRMRQGSATARC